MDSVKKPFVVSVEGNIGSGKSTMLDFYCQLEDVQLHPEPVEKWQAQSPLNF
jgi:ABC-type polar amino acid transport system ATPase subunit